MTGQSLVILDAKGNRKPMNKTGRNTKMTEKCNCDKDEKQIRLILVIYEIAINSEALWGTDKDANSKTQDAGEVSETWQLLRIQGRERVRQKEVYEKLVACKMKLVTMMV